ncbi:MAG: hypothetical protein U5K72_15025 [Balneolaceae bacterium]|nr:hypothetical protein [Balneolaceae bacterium]
MKPFYSVLYLKPESVSEEKIAVGLFLKIEDKSIFEYSGRKLKVASKIIESEVVDSIEKKLKNIKKKIGSLSNNENQMEAFDVEPFTISYFDYLSRYANNLLVYSKPSENIGDFTKRDFSSLFKLTVDKTFEEEKEETVSYREIVRDKLQKSVISERVDIRYRVPKNRVKSIYRNHEVDYIGVNGSIVSGNSIDTRIDPYSLENKIYLLRALIDGLLDLSESYDMKDGGHHIIFYNEPEERKQKDILHDALNDETSKFFLKPWDEFESIEKWIIENDVKKFSEFISK